MYKSSESEQRQYVTEYEWNKSHIVPLLLKYLSLIQGHRYKKAHDCEAAVW